jgi:hypothetical protein
MAKGRQRAARVGGKGHAKENGCDGYQWPRFIFDPFITFTALEEADIISGKDTDTRIKPLDLTNGHGRYMAAAPERTLASDGGCPLNI